MSKLYLFEELEMTDIGWWNQNRKAINEVIDYVNSMQIQAKFDQHTFEVAEAMLDRLDRIHEDRGDKGFSDWQEHLIYEIGQQVKELKEDRLEN